MEIKTYTKKKSHISYFFPIIYLIYLIFFPLISWQIYKCKKRFLCIGARGNKWRGNTFFFPIIWKNWIKVQHLGFHLSLTHELKLSQSGSNFSVFIPSCLEQNKFQNLFRNIFLEQTKFIQIFNIFEYNTIMK